MGLRAAASRRPREAPPQRYFWRAGTVPLSLRDVTGGPAVRRGDVTPVPAPRRVPTLREADGEAAEGRPVPHLLLVLY